jgi:hypothetical protein
MIRDALCTLMTYCTLVAYPQEEGSSIVIQVELNCFFVIYTKDVCTLVAYTWQLRSQLIHKAKSKLLESIKK